MTDTTIVDGLVTVIVQGFGEDGHGSTVTTAAFEIPAVGTSVEVRVADPDAFPVGQYLLISDSLGHVIVGDVTALDGNLLDVNIDKIVKGSVGDTMPAFSVVTFSAPPSNVLDSIPAAIFEVLNPVGQTFALPYAPDPGSPMKLIVDVNQSISSFDVTGQTLTVHPQAVVTGASILQFEGWKIKAPSDPNQLVPQPVFERRMPTQQKYLLPAVPNPDLPMKLTVDLPQSLTLFSIGDDLGAGQTLIISDALVVAGASLLQFECFF